MARTLFLVGFGVVIFGTVAAFRLGWPVAEAGYGVVVVTSLVLAFRIGLFGDGRGGGGGGGGGAGAGGGGGSAACGGGGGC